jgi:hypothetical protein
MSIRPGETRPASGELDWFISTLLMMTTLPETVEIPDPDDIGHPGARWIWPVAGLAAVVLFEMTANLSLSALILCVKFGWADLMAARWITRSDTDPGRRRALCYFQIAQGALKIVLAGGALGTFLAVLTTILHGQGQRPGLLAPIAAIALTALVGFLLSGLLSLLGLRAALRTNQRIWLDRRLDRNLPGDYPPQIFSEANELPSLTGSLAFLSFVTIFVTGFGASMSLFMMNGGLLLISVAITFLTALTASLAVGIKAEKIRARTPEECWPELAEDNALWVNDDVFTPYE